MTTDEDEIEGDADPVAQELAADPAVDEDSEDELALQTPEPPLTVIGIGASAGGLEVLKEVIAALDENFNAAVLVAMHLSPSHESQLVEILTHNSKLPILPASTGDVIEPRHVYVTPPNANLTIVNGNQIELQPAAKGPYPKPSVDVLLRSLARECGEHAVGVILSGTGSDGAVGVREIKQAGGINIVQDPESARYNGMPLAAIGTDCVDLVTSDEKIADIMMSVLTPPEALGTQATKKTEDDHLRDVLTELQRVSKTDFSYIKPSTLHRRIARRAALHGDNSLADYIDRVRRSPEEARELARSVLISVTSFFRDPLAFKALAEQMKKLCEKCDSNGTLRIWVPACATGEEAYTIAMQYFDIADKMENPPSVMIFASDMDEQAVEKARMGFYGPDVVSSLPPGYLDRYFIRSGDVYQVRNRVRQSIVFSVQNLMRDPPFSRINLISCRNFLIYLRPQNQTSILELFHYALASGGILFLGSTETASKAKGLFREVSGEFRIYERAEADPNYRARVRGRLEKPFRPVPARAQESREESRETQPQKAAAVMASVLHPRWVIIDEHDILKFVSDRARELVEIPSGPTILRIHDVLRSELNLDLRGLLFRSRRAGAMMTGMATPCRIDGADKRIIPTVIPMGAKHSERWLIMLDVQDPLPVVEEGGEAESGQVVEASYVKDLEHRLEMLQQDMRSLSEELETSNEELQSQSEELQSSNEELQSMNEQLLTSNEELQSSNEEMLTVNEELRQRSDELVLESARLHALIDTLDAATMIFDAKLRLVSASRSTIDRYLSSDYEQGVFIRSVPWSMPGKAIVDAAQVTMETGDGQELEIERPDGSAAKVKLRRVDQDRDLANGLIIVFQETGEPLSGAAPPVPPDSG